MAPLPSIENKQDGIEQTSVKISQVSLRAPPQLKGHPDVFFTLLESQFASLRITVDDTKFHQTLKILPAEYLETIMYILRNPPLTGKYEAMQNYC